MPGRYKHHDDHQSHKPTNQTPRVQQNQVSHPAQSTGEEAVSKSDLKSQADILANQQFQTAQRLSLAGQIAKARGNRQLGHVLSSPSRNGHVIQREGPTTTHRTIQYGSSGPDVEEAQTKLNSAEANPPLAVDGIFGPLTRTAVVEFQSSNSLAPDGIVGPLTWGALDQVGPEPEITEPETTEPETTEPETPVERWSEDDSVRLTSQASDTGPLNAYQATRATMRVYELSESEYSALRSLLDRAASDMEWAFLLKAAAAQRSIEDITTFADRILGMSGRWLMRNLMVVDLVNDLTPGEADPEERGIMQQYGNSCGPTAMQLIHAQADPIYALELRSAGPIDEAPDQAVANPDEAGNQQLANEQADILTTHGSTPENRVSDVATQGGAWVEGDLNELANATGVTYTTQLIGTDLNMDEAIMSLRDSLASGVHVPIVVGGGYGARNTSHYVVVMIASGDRFLVHDVFTGDTIWRTEEQFRNNTLDLPSGWDYFVAIDVPALQPPPLPEPPAPSGG
ncbi:MAG: peptidoglycan-binding protein [Chloroflexi bacterium]|nr:MAG: peptidoglycan-binding protein [Chloroflexota bacterium]